MYDTASVVRGIFLILSSSTETEEAKALDVAENVEQPLMGMLTALDT